jgi:hypothetical protein
LSLSSRRAESALTASIREEGRRANNIIYFEAQTGQTESKKRTVEWRSPVSFDQSSILADAAAADALVIRTVISLDRSRKYNQRVVFRRMVTLSVPGLATASDSLPLPSKSPTAIIPGL